MMRFLLDMNTINEPLKAAPNANVIQRLALHHAEFSLAATVWHELWFGCRRLPPSRRQIVIDAYLNELISDAVPILSYGTEAAEWHAAERSRLVGLGQTPAFADGQIAAVAAVNHLILVTRNVSDFAP